MIILVTITCVWHYTIIYNLCVFSFYLFSFFFCSFSLFVLLLFFFVFFLLLFFYLNNHIDCRFSHVYVVNCLPDPGLEIHPGLEILACIHFLAWILTCWSSHSLTHDSMYLDTGFETLKLLFFVSFCVNSDERTDRIMPRAILSSPPLNRSLAIYIYIYIYTYIHMYLSLSLYIYIYIYIPCGARSKPRA